jgi:hypothetical protein
MWQNLEGRISGSEGEPLLEEPLRAGEHVELFLGLVPRTRERTLHLRMSRESAAAFPDLAQAQGIWVRPFYFAGYALVVLALTDDARQDDFCGLAHDLMDELEKSADAPLLIRALAERAVQRFCFREFAAAA